jgi:hypothetical protein
MFPKWLLSWCWWFDTDLVQSLRHALPVHLTWRIRDHTSLSLVCLFRGASCLELQQTRRYVIARVPLHAAFRHRSERRSTYEKLHFSVERLPDGLMTQSGERGFQESITRSQMTTQGTTLHLLNRSAQCTTNRHDGKIPTRTHAEVEASLKPLLAEASVRGEGRSGSGEHPARTCDPSGSSTGDSSSSPSSTRSITTHNSSETG